MHPGRAQYTHLLDEDGFVVDDIIVWWVDEERFDVMPNASNTTDVVAAIGGDDVTERAGRDRRAGSRGPRPPGPGVARGRRRSTASRSSRFEWGGAPCLVAGTGYTGEDGVECAVPAEVATGVLGRRAGRGRHPGRARGPRHASPRGGASRCTATSSGPGITPLQAGLGWVVGWDKGDFTGRAALEEERANGPARRLRGFVADGRQPLRDGSLLCEGPEQVGILTSGNFSPMRERGIGLGFVDADARLLDGDAVTDRPAGQGAHGTSGPTTPVADPRGERVASRAGNPVGHGRVPV